MGLFVEMTAFRTADARELADALIRYSAKQGVPAEIVNPGAEVTRDAARIAPPQDGWCIIDWPRYFVRQATTSQWLSAELGLVASSINVFEGDVWSHVAYESGGVRDRFSSIPRYEKTTSMAEAKRRWAGNPAVVAQLFDRPERDIAAYFVHLRQIRMIWMRLRGKRYGKAFSDDKFHLDDEWVFTDFWRRAGIVYPETATWAHVVQWHPPGSERLPYVLEMD